MGAKEQAERLEAILIIRDERIAALEKENAELKARADMRGKRLKKANREITDADPLYTKGYTRKDGTYVKPYRKKE